MERWDCGPDQRVKRGAAFRQWQTPVLDSAERARILYVSSPHKPHSHGKVPAAGSLRVRAQAEIPGQRARRRLRAAHLGEPFAFRAYRGPTNRRACLSDSSCGTNDDPIELRGQSARGFSGGSVRTSAGVPELAFGRISGLGASGRRLPVPRRFAPLRRANRPAAEKCGWARGSRARVRLESSCDALLRATAPPAEGLRSRRPMTADSGRVARGARS